ncbi:MAG: SLC13 family permease [Alistipes putredinis]|uniref:SLC13 family permease n=1 Tax=Alistipes putredinis TaxID=28117 RepID=UPI003999725B
MIITMILIFVLGYLCIALEHKLRIDKAAIALLMCGALWTVLSLLGNDARIGTQLIEQLGDTSEILFFLIGAMTIVELIDRHGGFHVITDHIKTRNKRKLLWLLSIIAFFMSAVLDNMTTTIIMIMLLRRVIGDVTTIMLWMRGNVTSGLLVAKLFLPALVSIIIPTAIACRYIPDEDVRPEDFDTNQKLPPFVGPRFSHFVLVLGVGGLLFVPVFKAVTGLPPYLGMLISLGVLWVFTEIVYDQKHNMEESIKNRVSKVLKHIDMPTILFFLGILMSVSALQSAGLLTDFADFLDKNIHEVYTIAGITGLLSAVIDNVPLVAACMGMYPVADTTALASSLDPAYMQAFVQDGIFWHLLTFCAGVGGSLLIIGSAAGVVAMGLEKIEFGWYLRKITLLALAGYFAGMLVIFLEHLLLG